MATPPADEVDRPGFAAPDRAARGPDRSPRAGPKPMRPFDGPVAGSSQTDAAGPTPRPARALLIEGSDERRQRLKDQLSVLGCSCDAPDPLHAQVAVDARYDFVFLDVGLPYIDAVAVARTIRQRLGPLAPFLVGVGGADAAWTRDEPNGLDYFLPRPVRAGPLRAILGDLADA